MSAGAQGNADRGGAAEPGRVLAVDLGEKRVGIALSDPLRLVASPLTTIAMKSESALAGTLSELCARHSVALVVIGLPLSADGSEGAGCARARRLGARLGAAGLPFAYQDESWTSREAEDALRAAGRTRRRSRDRIDSMAASLILREYLSEASRS